MNNKGSIKSTYIYFLWHAFFLSLTMSMIDFNTVFPYLLTKLSDSKIVFGLLYSIMLGAPFVFNLVFSHIMKNYRYKKKFLLPGIYLRAFSFLGMAVFLFYFASEQPSLVIYSFVLWISLFSISGGFAGIAFLDIIGKMVPDKRRGHFFASRQLSGSLGAVAGWLVIKKVLDLNVFDFPLNYIIILSIAFVGLIIASIAFWPLKEPPSTITEASQSFWVFFRSIPGILKADKKFLRFIIIQNTTSISLMVLPFYIIFAKEVIRIDNSFVSTYLIAQVIGTISSNFIWGKISTVWNTKAVVRSCILLGSLVPLAAMLTARWGAVPFSIVFFLIGFLISGRKIGFDSYLLSLATEENRTVYLGISGTLSILVAVSPLLGGTFIEFFGYYFVFIAVTAVMLTSFFLLKD